MFKNEEPLKKKIGYQRKIFGLNRAPIEAQEKCMLQKSKLFFSNNKYSNLFLESCLLLNEEKLLKKYSLLSSLKNLYITSHIPFNYNLNSCFGKKKSLSPYVSTLV